MVDELGQAAVGVDDALGEFTRMARRVADALDAVDFGDVVKQQGEVRNRAVGHLAAIGVHVLAEKRHFPDALIGKLGDLHEDVHHRARDLLAAGVGHHAVGAVLRAAFHDRDEGGGAMRLRGGQMIELLDFGEAHVDLGTARLNAGAKHVGQTMQGLRSKDHVNAGRAADDVFALLARDAAAHGDQHAGTRLLDFADAAEVGESLLLGLFTNGAGVDDDQVGLLKHVGAFIAHFGVEKVGDATAVVVVHLAAEAAQIEFLRLHGLDPGTMFRAAGPWPAAGKEKSPALQWRRRGF